MGTGENAKRDFDSVVEAHASMVRATGGSDWDVEDGRNILLGRNILREELGFFGPWEGQEYSLDPATRDRFVAHTRQDVASAYAMARSAFREAHAAHRATRRLTYLLVASLALNVLALSAQYLTS